MQADYIKTAFLGTFMKCVDVFWKYMVDNASLFLN